jgi:hypothetical protein
MTINYAVIAGDSIVLASDSQVTGTHFCVEEGRNLGTYNSTTSKITEMENGGAYAVSGEQGLIDELLFATKDLNDSLCLDMFVDQFRDIVQKVYDQRYPSDSARMHCAFLFCGYERSGDRTAPKLIKLASHTGFVRNVVAMEKGSAMNGREKHGAVLYLDHYLRNENETLEHAKWLAYCVVAEVAELDNMVDLPVRMVVIRPTGIERITNMRTFERRRRELRKALRAFRK